MLIVVRLTPDGSPLPPRPLARHGLGVAAAPLSPFGRGPQDEDLSGGVLEHPRQVLRREAGAARRGRRDDDAVERLDLPEAAERVDRRAAALDARVDRHACAPRCELDGFEDRHRATELAVLDRRVEAELEGHDQEVCGDEHRVLGARDAKRRVEDGRIELTVGERDEEPRLAGSALRDRLPPGSSHERSSSRSARWATTRMSMPGSSRIIREIERAARDLDPAALVGRADEDVRGAALGGDAAHRVDEVVALLLEEVDAEDRGESSERGELGRLLRVELLTRPPHPERVDLAAEPLRRPPRAAEHALRARLRLDEREHALADRLLAERVEHGRAAPRLDVLRDLAQRELAERREVVLAEEVQERPLGLPARVDLARRAAGPGAPRARCRRE